MIIVALAGPPVLWTGLGLLFGWQMWVWGVLILATWVAMWVAWWLWSVMAARPAVRAVPEVPATAPPAPAAPTPAPPAEHPISKMQVRTAHDDYHFLFSCVVRWRPAQEGARQSHSNPAALAVNAIADRAAGIGAAFEPRDADRARCLLEAELGTARNDETGQLTVWAESMSLELSERDLARLDKLEEVRKEEELFERECGFERKVRTYLGDDVLTSVSNAVVWWLARNETAEKKRVEAAVGHIGTLRQLVSSATGAVETEDAPPARGQLTLDDAQVALSFETTTPPSPPGMPVARPEPDAVDHAVGIVEHLPDPQHQAVFTMNFARLLRQHGLDDAAVSITDRFDRPRPDESDSEADTPAEVDDDGTPEFATG
ncbi:hypothetical protein FB384_004410 [Prauserella sediminis]|uniref:Uncharacterized protein n=1 Tax=Prauserella sediminis TaxID=577680 RepID=A0A839XYE2_9PSEU|nr:hypothetical protein [Prauserella sediminis]MBB3665453.1 hypothetical protein [Prauserella sediminis]